MLSVYKKGSTVHHSQNDNAHPFDNRSNVIVQIFQLNRKEIEKIISISIDYLDFLDGDADLEQDRTDEPNGDEDDYTTLEWHNAIN